MKRVIVSTALCVLIFAASAAMAGPLDRTGTVPRTNPVVQGMIRVPGVVGLDQQSAMAAIQQAGLGVMVKASKKKPEGQEGKVISQVPNPGGTAMYGTTVTIYVFKPAAVVTTPTATTESGTGATTNTGTINWGYQPVDQTTTTTTVPTTDSSVMQPVTQP